MRPVHATLIVLAVACGPATRSPAPAAGVPPAAPASADARLRIRGRLVPDRRFLDDAEYRAAYQATPSPFGGAEVVFTGVAGEVSAIADADGRYDLRLAPGRYRAFVRGDNAVSVVENLWYEPAHLAREPGRPRLDLALLVELSADVIGLDLPVLQVGRFTGEVVADGRPVQGAVVRQGSNAAVIAGTDIAVTDAAGRYQVVASPGPRTLEVSHPDFARAWGRWLHVRAGERVDHDVFMTAGCAVSGRIIRAGGGRAGPGVIVGGGESPDDDDARDDLAPTAIADDGSFRWTTTDTGTVVLRAWPAQLGPSAPKRFRCAPGARFEGVRFRFPRARPSLTGVVLRHDGTPMPSARVLANSTSANLSAWQYAVTDAQGRFALRSLPPGQYLVTASTPADGLAQVEITLPQHDLRLELSGTTRIEGTSPHLREGTFLLHLRDPLLPERGLDRLVPVHDGRFVVDDIPASFATIELAWQDQTGWFAIDPRRETNRVAIILGPPQPKRVSGVIRFEGKPVRATVSVRTTPGSPAPTRVDVGPDGRFVIDTYSGAELEAELQEDCDLCDPATGSAQVSAHVGRQEHLDLDLERFDVGED